MDDYLKKIGKQIRTLRLSRNLTIAQLSEMIGKSDNFVGNIERGEGAPAIQTLIDIANALDVGTDVILRECLSIYQNIGEDENLYNQIKMKIRILSADEQRDILSMIELMTHFKSI